MNLQQQMNLFQEGGLEQDGNTIDPVSGNDVPVGSSQEEVRDDIPAQLSEGEFVFPADVVRFLGLEFLMKLRQRAKAGLARMEEMGQMGNSEEATVPDNIPFTIDDLDMEDEPQKMQTGGDVNTTGTYKIPTKFRRDNVRVQPLPRISRPNEEARFYNAPSETDEEEPTVTYDELMGSDPYNYDELRKFVGPNGEIQYVAYKDGKPLPAYESKVTDLLEKGYKMVDPSDVEEVKDTTDVGVETAQVRPDKDRDSTSPQNMRKAEEERKQSFKSAIEAVMKEQGLSAAEAVQYIKDGKHKIKGIKVPGFLFTDFNLVDGIVDESGIARSATWGLDEAAEEVAAMSGFDDPTEAYPSAGVGTGGFRTNIEGNVFGEGSTVGQTVGSTSADTSPSSATVKAAEAAKVETIGGDSKTEPVVSDMPMGSKPIVQQPLKYEQGKDIDKLTTEMEDKTYQQVQDPSQLAQAQAVALKAQQDAAAEYERQKQQDENEQTRQKAKDDRERQQSTAREVEKVKEEVDTGSWGRYGFKEGGIASKKPKKKKKVMKRGGLASKK